MAADPVAVFDRRTLRARRDRAAGGLESFDFLIREVADRLLDRLDDVRRRFPVALDLGCHTGQIARALAEPGRGGVETLVQADLSSAMVGRAAGGLRVVADEEALPFGPDRFDLVLSAFSLHWANDLPGALAQIRYALKPDGLFLAALPGGASLGELRQALMAAEIEREGGAGPRVSPFADVRDAGMLLQRVGFALPVVDVDEITVTYANALELVRDLRGMGEANALTDRSRRPLGRATLLRVAEIYRETFADARSRRVPATFQILFLTGWKPHPAQPRPLRRGSARASLAEALGVPVEVLEGGRREP